jgi:predicted RNA-binding Zn ribbon-like protein
MTVRADSAAAASGVADTDPPLTGEPLPLELVNTTFVVGGLRGVTVDALTDPARLDRWLADRADLFPDDLLDELRGRGSTLAALQTFHRLRAALRACLTRVVAGGPLPPGAVEEINRRSRAAGRDELVPGSPAGLRRHRPDPDPWRSAAGDIATEAIGLLAGPAAGQLRACPAPGCILFFLRQHNRREWCTDVCGNRVRVARHDRRRRADPPASS